MRPDRFRLTLLLLLILPLLSLLQPLVLRRLSIGIMEANPLPPGGDRQSRSFITQGKRGHPKASSRPPTSVVPSGLQLSDVHNAPTTAPVLRSTMTDIRERAVRSTVPLPCDVKLNESGA